MTMPAKGNATEVGTITTSTDDGDKHTYKYAILVEFDSAEEVRKALQSGRIECTVFGEQPCK